MGSSRLRLALVGAVATAAATGVLAGLSRLGLGLGWGPAHAANHGPLLVLGVFAVVVSRERALAFGGRWASLVPLAFGLTAVALLLRSSFAPWIAVAASAGLLATNLLLLRRRATEVAWLVLAGSGLLLLGTLRWASGEPASTVALTWTGFFVLTIAGERARLSRRATGGVPGVRVLGALAGVLVVALAARAFDIRATTPLAGLAMAGLAGWQWRYDAARDAIRQDGLPRYTAHGVRAGTVWLLAAGVLLTLVDPGRGGPLTDAVLHAVFVGYLLSTAFAHGLDVVPVMTGLPVPFSAWFYLPLALLHGSLALRLLGDLAGDLVLRRAGAAGNALAIALFAATAAFAALRRPRR